MALPFLTPADTGSWVTFPGPPVPPGGEQLLETRVWCRACAPTPRGRDAHAGSRLDTSLSTMCPENDPFTQFLSVPVLTWTCSPCPAFGTLFLTFRNPQYTYSLQPLLAHWSHVYGLPSPSPPWQPLQVTCSGCPSPSPGGVRPLSLPPPACCAWGQPQGAPIPTPEPPVLRLGVFPRRGKVTPGTGKWEGKGSVKGKGQGSS